MSEWWSYRPADFLLFSPRTYWRLFELHNAQWWPLHGAALALMLGALWWWRRSGSARALLGVLGVAWAFVGWAFHWQRYAGINWAATWIGDAFILQGLLLLALAGGRARPPSGRAAPAPRLGLLVLLAALLLYPWLGWAVGRPLAQAESFGLAPDPTALATLGTLALWAPDRGRWLWRLAWALPLAWCALSGLTHWVMHEPL